MLVMVFGEVRDATWAVVTSEDVVDSVVVVALDMVTDVASLVGMAVGVVTDAVLIVVVTGGLVTDSGKVVVTVTEAA